MATAAGIDILVEEPRPPSVSWLPQMGRAARRNPAGAVAGIACILLVVLAIFGPSISPYSPNRVNFERLQSPSASHPLGVDHLSRDMLSRIIYGARNSLGIGFAAIAVSTSLGIFLGISSGYFGGILDLAVSRVIDIMLAYPALVFVIFIVAIFGRDFVAIAIGIGLILTPGATRVVRSATIGVRNLAYIEAARSLGASDLWIMRRHVLPNVAAPIIVIASVNIGLAILIEAAISFLGLGVSSPTNPSWGRMLQETRTYWQLAWWTMIIPGLAISLAVLSFNLFGDALRDALDPRLRGSR
ncbi:MAG TPA: ABC transporter permease [Dehalococcoidia bacterium]|nr:ABC transporter permease [Dehalococcoidia bacterium]